MTDEERRRLEERRKREMMSEAFQRHIQATLQARAAGKPDPAPLDESGQLIRPYADPRDATIASSPALVRPVHSILDRMLRPGRAGMADRMNREYLEGVLKRDADQRMGAAKLKQQQASAVIADLQRRAATGDKPALDLLTRYSQASNAGRSGNTGFDYSSLFNQRDDAGQAKPRTPESPTETPPESPNRTGVSDAQQRRASAGSNIVRTTEINDIQERLANIRNQIAVREADPSAGGKSPSGRGMLRIPLQTLKNEEAALVQELSNLQQPLRPPAGAGTATVAPRE
jgi:hypothetical protein